MPTAERVQWLYALAIARGEKVDWDTGRFIPLTPGAP